MLTRVTHADAVVRRWAPSRRARAAIAGGLLVSTVLQIVGVPFTSSFGTRTRIDLDVYRLGAQIWQQGLGLYADGSMPFTADGIWLPFTYPPFAALGFVPLGALPLGAAGVVISVLTVALTVLLVRIVIEVCDVGAASNRWWIAMMVAIGSIWLNPVWMTLGFGQINIVLVAMIMVDIFVLGRGRAARLAPARGVLIGLAAAVKLTPLVFIVVFLAARQWRAAATSAVTFVGAAAVAWVWLPADSWTYWTHTLFHTTRIGDPAGRINQNLNAMWIRLIPQSATAEQVMWVVSSLAATALMVVAVRSCRPVSAFAQLVGHGADSSSDGATGAASATAGVNAMLTTCSVAVWGLLVSPTSWAHHWVWSIPIILTTTVIAVRSTTRTHRIAYGSCAVAGLVIFALGPFQFLRPASMGWSPLDHIVGNAYSLWGIAFLGIVWLLPSTSLSRRPGGDVRELADLRSP